MNDQLGKRLTKAREAQGLSIEEAAHATRLRPSHVQALEDGRLERFPNAAYAKGFLTMYARFLKVDVMDVTSAIETTTQMRVSDFQYLSNRSREDGERRREATDARYDFVVPEKDRSWTPLFVIGGCALVAAVSFAVWTNMSRIGQTADDPAPPVVPQEAPPARVAAAQQSQPENPPAPEPEIPRPRVISIPDGAVPVAVPVVRTTAPEPEIPRARPVSPVAELAADDAAALAQLTPTAPRAIPVKKEAAPAVVAPPAAVANATPPAAPADEEDNSPLAADPNTIVIEPRRKAWIVIRNGPGGQPLYEDFLYPSAKPMRLPAGRYFIELKEPDSVEISRNGRNIAYNAPGVLLE